MTDEADFSRDVAAMRAHMEATGHDLFRASQYWTHFADINAAQLRQMGLGNFKRSVNQNYFNWIPDGIADNQFRRLARFWGEQPALDVLAVKLEDASSIATAFGDKALATPEQRDLYRVFVGLLWHFTRRTCANGLTEALAEPALGNPIGCTLDGRAISQDLANSIRERTAALALLEADMAAGRTVRVVEVGAGYGRLGFVLLSSAPCRYCVVDIPPALALSQWYLTTLFPARRAFRFRPFGDFATVAEEFGAADIAFLTPDQFALIPAGTFDVGITISTLPEMTRAQFDFYLARLAATASRVVYTRQWIEHVNRLDNVAIGRADFRLPAPWRLEMDRVDAVQDAFFERLWVRG